MDQKLLLKEKDYELLATKRLLIPKHSFNDPLINPKKQKNQRTNKNNKNIKSPILQSTVSWIKNSTNNLKIYSQLTLKQSLTKTCKLNKQLHGKPFSISLLKTTIIANNQHRCKSLTYYYLNKAIRKPRS